MPGIVDPDGRPRWGVIALLSAAIIAGLFVIRMMTAPGPDQARQLRVRQELQSARLSVDSCKAAIAAEEDSFRDYDRRVDSLRRAVRAFEAEDPDGVPAEQYEQYLGTFDRYNAAVPAWRERADSLRSHLEACRAMAERHNLLADSLRGLLPDSLRDPLGGGLDSPDPPR